MTREERGGKLDCQSAESIDSRAYGEGGGKPRQQRLLDLDEGKVTDSKKPPRDPRRRTEIQNLLHSRRAVEAGGDSRLVNTKARYLKKLTLAFLTEVETLGRDRHLNIEHGLSLREEVRRFEIDLIKNALLRTGGNQTRAAALLRVKVTTLNSKIKLYHLQTQIFRPHSTES